MGNYILGNGMRRKMRKVGLGKNFQKESIIMKDII